MKKLVLLLAFLALATPAFAADAPKESVYDRIVRTGVIRCGYYVFPPATYRDPNTDKLSGLSVDYMERIAKRAALKIEWTEEVTWANWIPELQAGRFDVACTPMWPELSMLKAVTFTTPLFFAGMYPIVRTDDARFKSAGPERLDKPDVTVLTQEGNITDSVARDVYPHAKFYTIPSTASGGEYYQSLLGKKADVVLGDHNGLYMYEKDNGKGKFRIVGEGTPVKVQPFPLAVGREETGLRDFLNQSIAELEYSGETDRMLRKWEPEPGKTYLRVSPPYKGVK